MIGIPIGILIGIVTGTIFLVLLRTFHRAKNGDTTSVMAIVSEIAAIPAFWFGGPWITTSLLKLVSLPEMINWYISTLAIVFSMFVGFPVLRWIGQTAAALGREA